MNFWRLIVTGIFIFVHGSAAAQFLPLNLKVTPPAAAPEIDPDKLYAVELSCEKKGIMQPYADGFLARTTYTTSISVFVSRQPPTAKPGNNEGEKLPSSTIAFAPIALVDKSGQVALDNTAACDRSYLVYHAHQLFLVPVVSVSTSHQAGTLLTSINKVIDVATSIAPIFAAGGIPAAIASKLGDVKKAEGPINELIKTFDDARNHAPTSDLRVGTTLVETDYTTISVVVRPIEVIITDPKNKAFADDLRKQIEGGPDKLSDTDLKPDCTSYGVALNNVGIKATQDKAYAIGFLALKSFKTKDQIMSCLGRDYVLAAAQLGDILWKGYPTKLVVSVPDAGNQPDNEPTGPVQPLFEDVREKLEDLMVALGQYAGRKAGQSAPSETISNLKRLFGSHVTVVDRTTSGIFGAKSQTFAIPGAIDYLISKKFRRFGCFAETSDATGKYSAGARVIFLAFNAVPRATRTKIDNAVAIHPLYEKRVITALRIADNSAGWVSKVLANRAKADWCENLQVQK